MKALLNLLLIMLMPTMLLAQSSMFYYAYNEQVPLTKSSNKAVIKMNEDVANPNIDSLLLVSNLNVSNMGIETVDIRTFIVSYSAIENLIGVMNQQEQIHTAQPVYLTIDGLELGVNDKIVVRLNEGASVSASESLISALNITIKRETYGYTLLSCPEKGNALLLANQLAASGHFKFAHPNFIAKTERYYIPNDPYFNFQWGLHNTGQTINDGHIGNNDADVDAPEAWDITLGNANILIAVIDEGVTDAHPDLPSSRQVRLNGSNFAAPYDGSNPNNPEAIGNGNHGNACSGIIAATMDNNEGITGIAPLCHIMPVRIPFGPYPATVYADAINFAWQNGADILSNSWGYGSSNPNLFPVIRQAIEDATINGRGGLGSVVAFAAGNTANHAGLNNGIIIFPGNVIVPGVLTVGASDRYDSQSNYSPTSNLLSTQNQVVDLTAPSHRAYSCQISGETFEVWSIDIPGNTGYNPWPQNGDCGPIPPLGEQLPNSGTNFLSYTGRMGGTSAATPLVAGIAALMLSVNPCLSQLQVFDILTNTTDKVGGYQYQNGFSNELGYGRVNAFKAVSAALAMYNAGLDVYTKDTPVDWGVETNPDNGPMWISEDIWVRNTNDGFINQTHENPVFATNPNYVYVRVRNKGCNPSLGTEELKLHWAKAASALSWPDYWDISFGVTCNGGPPMGDIITLQIIPVIPPGGETILEFQWNVPDPDDYNGCNLEPAHFCLLSRILAPNDPMTFPEVASVYDNAKNNNNIAWKNITIVHMLLASGNEECPHDQVVGGTIAIGNPFHDSDDNYKLEFKLDEKNRGIPLNEQAEIKVTLDDLSWEKWMQGGHQGENIRIKREDCHQLIITGNPATLKNLHYEPMERSTINLSFNFLTDKVDAISEFDYHVIQTRTEDDKIIGGELYRIKKTTRYLFGADAGSDRAISEGASTILNASNIGESAYNNWYDTEGNLIYSGNNFTVSPEITSKYKLQVIAHSDGFSSYDSVTVTVKDCEIQSITPNPSSNQIIVQYKAQNVTSGYLVITHASGSPNDNYILNLNQNTKVINVANYASGNYNLILVCDGEVKDQKLLSIIH